MELKPKKSSNKPAIPQTDDVDSIAESLFNCSISTTSKAINIHVSGFQRADTTIANDVINVVVAGFKKATIDAARAKREADKEILRQELLENTNEPGKVEAMENE